MKRSIGASETEFEEGNFTCGSVHIVGSLRYMGWDTMSIVGLLNVHSYLLDAVISLASTERLASQLHLLPATASPVSNNDR